MEHGLYGAEASVVVAPGLESVGSVVAAHRLSCSVACGILPDQGSILCPLHWQADSYPLYHQGSPACVILNSVIRMFTSLSLAAPITGMEPET